MRISNSGVRLGALRLRELVFQGYFPYEHAAIGSLDALDSAELGWVERFHQRYYAPNNAVLSIVGDFDPSVALSLVQKPTSGTRWQSRRSPSTRHHRCRDRRANASLVDRRHQREDAGRLLRLGDSSRANARVLRSRGIGRDPRRW